MHRIILIETSTALCSTALSEDGKTISSRESDTPRAHAAMTAPFIKEMLDEKGISVADCDAVCVSAGPGSYTGLRVGASTAKGLCFASGKPLLSINTLDVLVQQALDDNLVPEGCSCVVPMIDARRMEIYSAIYEICPDRRGFRRLTEIEPVIVDADSFADKLAEGQVLFIGDGAAKCAGVITSANASFVQLCPNAAAMSSLAEKLLNEKKFEDTAYFEPFYLKQFVATTSRKKLF